MKAMMKIGFGEEIYPHSLTLKEFKYLGYSEIKVYEYEYKFGKPNLDGKLLLQYLMYDKDNNVVTIEDFTDYNNWRRCVIKYNAKGSITEGIFYKNSGNIYKRWLREYNDKELLIREREYDEPHGDPQEEPQGRPQIIMTNKYRDSGIILTKEVCFPLSIVHINNYVTTYNDMGLKTERVFRDNNGVLTEKQVFNYNDKGLMTERLSYDSEGKLGQKSMYKYNDMGLEVERLTYSVDHNQELGKELWSYNDRGQKMESLWYWCGKLQSKCIYKYDDKGLIIETAWWYEKDGKERLTQGYRYQYNDKDVLIGTTWYNSLEEPTKTTVMEYK
jgi:hypothetical protein